jgi:hypothetical protein
VVFLPVLKRLLPARLILIAVTVPAAALATYA